MYNIIIIIIIISYVLFYTIIIQIPYYHSLCTEEFEPYSGLSILVVVVAAAVANECSKEIRNIELGWDKAHSIIIIIAIYVIIIHIGIFFFSCIQFFFWLLIEFYVN